MGDDLLHPVARWATRGPRLVLFAGVACFLVLMVLSTPGHAAPNAPHAAGPAVANRAGGRLGSQGAPDQVSQGRQLYVVHCSSCHGVNALGTSNGPDLTHAGAVAADFYLRTGRMPLNDPRDQPVRHPPAFPPDQIAAMVAYIGALDNGPAIPTVLNGDVASGNQLYSENCAQCHNVAGAGGALGYGDIVPSLSSASTLDVVEAMRTGPRPMPVFGPQTLSDRQASDIAAYVQYLHHPDDRGGLGLGHIGPIPEGFVGWVVGMGALLLVARLIGTRG